ncbi:MAG TPA: SDR family oxidoreductase [Phycisphaerae bacterium]|nr:SDR family oxidoreductase [Phycisphaerales bacterium]HRX86613.1 SDR family oxidoreductase [Phycisphaerae bacterium]
MSRSNILVTGGAGFIGSHLATRFCELGHAVRVLDNFATGNRANLAHLGKKVDIVEGDLGHPEECERACRDIDFIFHVAALPSVPVSVERPVDTHAANITGTLNLLMAARANKCRRVIYSGSSSCYGETEVSPKHEGICPAPLSPYAVQKLAGEHYMSAFHHCYGLETLTTRYFNVFGPRQNPKSQYAAVIPAFITAMLDDRAPTIYGDGKQTRDFTFVENITHAYMLAVDLPKTTGQTVNVACGYEISLLDIVAHLNRLLGKDIRPTFEAPRAGDVRHSRADITAAHKLLGYSPVVTFDEGLRRTLEHYAEKIS